jgi:hypothetical protein
MQSSTGGFAGGRAKVPKAGHPPRYSVPRRMSGRRGSGAGRSEARVPVNPAFPRSEEDNGQLCCSDPVIRLAACPAFHDLSQGITFRF